MSDPHEQAATEAVENEAVDAELDGEMSAYLADEESAPQETPEPEEGEGEVTDQAAAPEADDKYTNLQKALAESRFEGRQTKRQLEEIKQLLQRSSQSQGDDDPLAGIDIPDASKDPLGAIEGLTKAVNAYRQREQQQLQARQKQQAEQQAIQQLTSYMQDGEAQFRAQAPDYDEAAKFLVESRTKELTAIGHAPEAVQNGVYWEYLNLINQARQNGQNPAALVYQQAKARGYTGAAAEPKPDPKAQAQLDAMKRGAQAPKPARGGGGGSNAGEVTLEMLEKASGAEYDKLWARYEAQHAGAA